MTPVPTIKNKVTIWSLGINGLLLLALLLLLRGSACRHAANSIDKQHTSDTTIRYVDRTDTMYRTLTAYVPQVQRVIVHTPDTMQPAPAACLCSDTAVYSDSIYRAREFKAVISDRITANRIAQRTIQWADLTPITDRTVTNTVTISEKPPLVKVYLGADAGLRYAAPLWRGGVDIAPSTSVVISDRYMIDAGYYILGGQISAGVKVKLSFRK